MKNLKISIIGGGNIGSAFALGMLREQKISPKNVIITRRNLEKLSVFLESGIQISADNREAARFAEIIILAVKPYQAEEILSEIAPEMTSEKIIVSMVTGLKISKIKAIVGDSVWVFRAMPNTAMATGESMTCLSSEKNCPKAIAVRISELFSAVGETEFIDESLQEASTILGASGIAFALRYIRAATQGGIEIGFSARTAQRIVAQTVKGAVSLLNERGEHPEGEIDLVTTPKGVTITGLNEMEHQGFSSALIKGLTASYRKIEDLK